MSNTTPRRIGPRMEQLCQILASMGGTAPSQASVYLQLSYHGRTSNAFGHAAMLRAQYAGLIRARPGEGNRIAVSLTDQGWKVAQGG